MGRRRKPKRNLCICLQQWMWGNTQGSSSYEPEDKGCFSEPGDEQPVCPYGRPRMVEWSVWLDQVNESPLDCATLPIKYLKKGRFKKVEARFLEEYRLREAHDG